MSLSICELGLVVVARKMAALRPFYSRAVLALVLALVLAASLASASFNETVGAASTTCICTSVPCPVSGENTMTEGGGAEGTYEYKTQNGHAVVVSASVKIGLANLDKGTDTTKCTQDYARSLDDDGTVDADAGHILAHRLGGIGSQPINIFPQDLSVNRGAYAQYENQIYDCIKTGGASSAALSWTFQYSSSTRTKPSKVTYTAVFTGGSCGKLSQSFDNGR